MLIFELAGIINEVSGLGWAVFYLGVFGWAYVKKYGVID